MKAFEPLDVYPCTIDEDYINLNISIASLFGHLCFGSTFAHDEEMGLLASQRKDISRGTNAFDSQTMTDRGKRSADQRGISPAGLLRYEFHHQPHALDDRERKPKRQRTNQLSIRNYRDDLYTEPLPTEVVIPRQKLPEFKQSLKSYLGQCKRETTSPITKSTKPLSDCFSDDTSMPQTTVLSHQKPTLASRLNCSSTMRALQSELLADHRLHINHKAQTAPIEPLNCDASSQGNEAGDFLLEEMPEPDDIPSALIESQSGSETQITLSDAAFESQSLRGSDRNIEAMRLQRRKEAYKAANEFQSTWEIYHELISSNAHHGKKELELEPS